VAGRGCGRYLLQQISRAKQVNIYKYREALAEQVSIKFIVYCSFSQKISQGRNWGKAVNK
jgi:hypothetical protein